MAIGVETAVCPECGLRLDEEPWSTGLCPRCLLRLAISESPDLSSEAPNVPTVEVSTDAPTVGFSDSALSSGEVHGDRYQIRALLGRGGMGEVWRAFDLKLRQDVALKALRTELIADPQALETLRQEVRAAREVVSPNVCRVFDLQELDGQELVSMEYIDGTTLQEILEERSPLELDEAREIASQFLAGLEAIHDAGLVHRDIKPENVMVTRTGRVVVMDFGIAKGLQEDKGGMVAGTPAYMSPEQTRGGELDARSDVYSAGVVLAEMVAPGGTRSFENRQWIWQQAHQGAPQIGDTPWASVVRSAISEDREGRFPSATSLARALEEVTLRAAGDEDADPYPGLASFTREQSKYFHGRELEVEALWKKLRRPHLLALIAPSGSGKSSFLHAGLLPTLPDDWSSIVLKPGDRPFSSLARSVAEVLDRDRDVVDELLRFEEPEIAVDLVSRWRKQHRHALVIVDQFEELFAQNPPEVQERFAELLARFPLESDSFVLLSMREDFLYHCQPFEALAPVFSELMPLGTLGGNSLRRALVQPALRCGYRFEDDALVDEMVEEVSHERGALPLLAFAASRLWSLRDRDTGLISRDVYDQIGGVGGALAQHAEATLERIGQDKVSIVRELFRNLVTAQGTRVARDREELLSVFSGQQPLKRPASVPAVLAIDPETAGTEAGRFNDPVGAETVLNTLIDARLLTSYEVAAAEDEDAGHTHIEIIHESLLSNWPRLVRWQRQDVDSAQMRDQVRQSAKMWAERGRPDDLLWTGTSFKEYELWRERYGGGLSTTEEEFTRAMTTRAERRKRLRRIVLTAAFAVLLVVLGVMANLWWRGELARRQAVAEARRAEASKLLAFGRLELEANHTAALAYATKALELADSPEARRFALEVLWRGPVARILPDTGSLSLAFSPDGRWLATDRGRVRLVADDGQESSLLGRSSDRPHQGWLAFSADSRILLRMTRGPAEESPWAPTLERWKLPHLRELPAFEWDRRIYFQPPGATGLLGLRPLDAEVIDFEVTSWSSPPFPDELGPSQRLGTWVRHGLEAWEFYIVDPTGTWILWTREGKVLLRELDFSAAGRELEVTEHDSEVRKMFFSPDGRLIATSDRSGKEIRIFSLADEEPRRIATLVGGESPDPLSPPTFSPDGSRLAMVSRAEKSVYLWDIQTPLDGRPLVLAKKDRGEGYTSSFHPGGDWLATLHGSDVAFWPMTTPYSRVLPAWDGVQWLADFAFSPDSRWLAGCAQGTPVQFWPLAPGQGDDRSLPGSGCHGVVFDPSGQQLLLGGHASRLVIRSLQTGEERVLTGRPRGLFYGVAFDTTGRLVAAAPAENVPGTEALLRVWNLDSGESWELDLLEDCTRGREWNGRECLVTKLRFAPDGRLFSGGPGGVRVWNVETGQADWIVGPGPILSGFDLSLDGRYLLTAAGQVDLATGSVQGLEYEWSDLENGARRRLDGFPTMGALSYAKTVALDTTGMTYAIGAADGTLFVGRAAGGKPHLLLGHREAIEQVAVSPDGLWIASRSEAEIRLWPMPDLSQPPFHTLPHNELLAKLRSLTNLRVAADPDSPNGWKLEVGPFPGWEEVPTW